VSQSSTADEPALTVAGCVQGAGLFLEGCGARSLSGERRAAFLGSGNEKAILDEFVVHDGGKR